MLGINVYTCKFHIFVVSVEIHVLELNRKMMKNMAQNCQSPYYKYYTSFTRFCRYFSENNFVFNMFSTLMLVEVKLSGIWK